MTTSLCPSVPPGCQYDVPPVVAQGVPIHSADGGTVYLSPKDVARIEAKVKECVRSMAGCWYWTGEIADGGYGRMWLKGRNRRIHRVMYELHVGPIPCGLVIDHLCRHRNCVNPDHLEPVSTAENTRRSPFLNQDHPDYLGPSKLLVEANQARSQRTSCMRGHEYVTGSYTVDANGKRYCRECRRTRWHEAGH